MANIGLIAVDGKGKFPNLPLMKLSAWHKKNGDAVEWYDPDKSYDRVCFSKVFTDTPDFQDEIHADEIIKGGTGYDLKNRLSDDAEHIYPDYSLYGVQKAYGFLTRGCPRGCGFCIVGEKEGRKSFQVSDLSEFWRGQKKIVLLDPNILACPEHPDLLRQLRNSLAGIDFTQGVDARLITEENARLLAQIKKDMLHFAWDHMENENAVMRGLRLYKRIADPDSRKTIVYILTNYNTTFEEDYYRVRKVIEAGYSPDIRVFNKGTEDALIAFLQRWANNRTIYRTVPDFFNYEPRKGVTVRRFMAERKAREDRIMNRPLYKSNSEHGEKPCQPITS